MSRPTKGIVIGTSVDASTWQTKYRAVDLATGETIFERSFIGYTNNCTGFLALAHAILHCRVSQLDYPIYCTNGMAIEWVKEGAVRSHTNETKANQDYHRRIRSAKEWLRLHKYQNELRHWDPKVFGDNPAAYNSGRRAVIGMNHRPRRPEERLADLIKASKKRNI